MPIRKRILSKLGLFLNRVDIEKVDDIYRMSDGTFTIYLPNDNPAQFYRCKEFTVRYDRYIDRLDPGDTVLKVGAAAGEDLIELSEAVGDTGEIYAFEPEPSNFSCLQKNIAHHSLENVTAKQLALSDSPDETVSFKKHTSSHTTHRVSTAPLIKDESEYETIRVPATTINEFSEQNEIGPISMLSVTVNRYEAAVLSGAREKLKQTEHVVIPENVDEHGDATAVLHDAGFTRVEQGNVGDLYVPESSG